MKQDHIFQYLISFSCCWISIWWLLISMYVLLSVDGQYWEEQLIDVLDDDSSSAGFRPISSFQLQITVPFLSAGGDRYGLNLWVHI